ncbi:GIY-YIG nuclease family protein [Sulfitobacter sp. 915]|uniref:GIY-YIG nuclease family protein n=1 Tax=Sulfitobacter sp. 915 TaxID=3368558 RepID=UPI00374636F2
MKGYVYVLSNPSMPGLVKIGRTKHDPMHRACQLFQTGVPQPFAVETAVKSPDCVELEANLHHQLRRSRLTKKREFFAVSVRKAEIILLDLRDKQLNAIVQEFAPELEVRNPNYVVDFCDIYCTFLNDNVTDEDVSELLCQLEEDDFKVLYERLKRRRSDAASPQQAEAHINGPH